MRFTRFGLLLCTLLLSIPVWARQASTPATPSQPPSSDQTSPATTPLPVTKDAQAMSVLNQLITVAGGTTAITQVADYTCTGTITYHGAVDVQGSITVRGSASGILRIDATLPAGVRSEVMGGAEFSLKTEDGRVTQPQLHAPMNPTRLVLPYQLLAAAVNSPGFNVFYKGLVDLDGHPAHDVQLVRVLPGAADPTGLIREYSTIDFFIDASTLQVLMMQDVVRRHQFREVRYSDYRLTNGVLVPFSISEHGGEQPAWEMNLSQIIFNTGSQDSDFQL